MVVRYPSKVDLWLALLVGVGLVGAMGASVSLALSDGLWWPAALMMAPVLLVGALMWPTEYLLADEELVVRSGVIRYRIRLEEVLSVSESREPWSSPAWSMDRLKIVYG